MARTSKLNNNRRNFIVQALRAGNHREAAARAAGIAPSTLYAWLARGGNEESGIYHDFSEAVQRAEGEAEVYAVAIIRQAMNDDWRAAISYLERRHPSRWRRQTSTELTGKDGGPVTTRTEHRIDLSALTDEELAILKRLHAGPNGARD